MILPQIIQTISNDLDLVGARFIVVGGSVRDYYLNLPSKDYDLEVYGIASLEKLEPILSRYGSVNLVGKSFGVLKFTYKEQEYDFSFPRRESKIGVGHKGFTIEIDNRMNFKEASLRRDFTINAMGYDLKDSLFLDPYKGLEDIKNKKLQHINDITFIEDPLRVYRAVQFCARFEFTLATDTFLLCKKMVENNSLETLPKERVYMELSKLLLKAQKPSLGFYLMQKLGIFKYFPELISIDFKILDYKNFNLIFMFVLLLEKSGVEKSKSFLYKISDEHQFIKKVTLLVEYFKIPSIFLKKRVSDAEIRRLATKVNITDLVTVSSTYDSLASQWLLERATILKVAKKPLDRLIQGRDLIALGLKPSSKFKKILDDMYELQIEGTICSFEESMKFLNSSQILTYSQTQQQSQPIKMEDI